MYKRQLLFNAIAQQREVRELQIPVLGQQLDVIGPILGLGFSHSFAARGDHQEVGGDPAYDCFNVSGGVGGGLGLSLIHIF